MVGGRQWISICSEEHVEEQLLPPHFKNKHKQTQVFPPPWQILDPKPPPVDTFGSHQVSFLCSLLFSSCKTRHCSHLLPDLPFLFFSFFSLPFPFLIFLPYSLYIGDFFYTDGAVSVSNYLLFYFEMNERKKRKGTMTVTKEEGRTFSFQRLENNL